MANIFDYLDWRGDIPFSADPFNEVDNLVLSYLSYVDFEGIVPEPGRLEKLPVAEVSREYWRIHDREKVDEDPTVYRYAPLLLEKLSDSVRFSGMRLAGYINHISVEEDEQMSAVSCYLPDETVYAAFRGTDDTLVGWKEDFNLSFMDETPGQKQAAEYLTKMFASDDMPVRTGGHSKGGNFAVYAAAFCDPSVRERITEVYTNDGPGFLDAVTKTDGYREILPRIISIIPEESVFGLILSSGYPHKVIKSSGKGIWQHDVISWEVLRNRFIEMPSTSQNSMLMEKTLDTWINRIPLDERKIMVEALFHMIYNSGAGTFSRLAGEQVRSSLELMRAYREMSTEEQQVIRSGLNRLLKSGAETLRGELQEKASRLKASLPAAGV